MQWLFLVVFIDEISGQFLGQSVCLIYITILSSHSDSDREGTLSNIQTSLWEKTPLPFLVISFDC